MNYPTFRSITTDTGKKDFFGKPITETKWVRSVGQLKTTSVPGIAARTAETVAEFALLTPPAMKAFKAIPKSVSISKAKFTGIAKVVEKGGSSRATVRLTGTAKADIKLGAGEIRKGESILPNIKIASRELKIQKEIDSFTSKTPPKPVEPIEKKLSEVFGSGARKADLPKYVSAKERPILQKGLGKISDPAKLKTTRYVSEGGGLEGGTVVSKIYKKVTGSIEYPDASFEMIGKIGRKKVGLGKAQLSEGGKIEPFLTFSKKVKQKYYLIGKQLDKGTVAIGKFSEKAPFKTIVSEVVPTLKTKVIGKIPYLKKMEWLKSPPKIRELQIRGKTSVELETILLRPSKETIKKISGQRIISAEKLPAPTKPPIPKAPTPKPKVPKPPEPIRNFAREQLLAQQKIDSDWLKGQARAREGIRGETKAAMTPKSVQNLTNKSTEILQSANTAVEQELAKQSARFVKSFERSAGAKLAGAVAGGRAGTKTFNATKADLKIKNIETQSQLTGKIEDINRNIKQLNKPAYDVATITETTAKTKPITLLGEGIITKVTPIQETKTSTKLISLTTPKTKPMFKRSAAIETPAPIVTPPPPPPFVIPFISGVAGRIARPVSKQGFNVFVKRARVKKGQPQFMKANPFPLSRQNALSLGSRVVDNS
ncbi:MAG TPA: hypothetical protein VMW25_01400, partial [Clostridia bacterium]|nr:hypothetical protein [Clostridia bacterium]